MQKNVFGSHTIQCMTLAVTVNAVLSGCASLSDIQQVRELPGFTRSDIPRENAFYDPTVRAYRQKTTKEKEKQPVLRGAMGKKVQTDAELTRYIEASRKEVIGTGTVAGVTALSLLLTPLIIPFSLADTVLSLPLRPIFSSIGRAYEREAENAYAAGRRHFDAGGMEAALARWERAMIVMPSLRGYSDIDYWRGRAFEAHGQARNARIAYETFLSYSEQSVPEYFTDKYPNDTTWTQKAEDAEKRIATLKDIPFSAPEVPKK